MGSTPCCTTILFTSPPLLLLTSCSTLLHLSASWPPGEAGQETGKSLLCLLDLVLSIMILFS